LTDVRRSLLPGSRSLRGLLAVGAVVLVFLVAAPFLGADDGTGDAPGTDPTTAAAPATPADLCRSLARMEMVRDQIVDGSTSATVEDLRGVATTTRTVAARTADLDDRSRAGLDFFTGLFLDLPDEPTTQQLLSAEAPASVTDQAHADAFVAWLDDHCGR
jgi:hypothetical protein